MGLRLRALPDEEAEPTPRRGRAAGLVAAGAIVAAASCLLLLHPWATASAVACC